jgi:hypothetical protein
MALHQIAIMKTFKNLTEEFLILNHGIGMIGIAECTMWKKWNITVYLHRQWIRWETPEYTNTDSAAAAAVEEENSRIPEPPKVARSAFICKRFKARDSNRCCNATPGDPHMRVCDAPNQLTLLLSHSLVSSSVSIGFTPWSQEYTVR